MAQQPQSQRFLPIDGKPTELLVQRINNWTTVIDTFTQYFKSYADAQKDIAKLHAKLATVAQSDTLASLNFLPQGQKSFNDVPPSLYNYHATQNKLALKLVEDIDTKYIRSLKELKSSVLEPRVSDIKKLKSHFNQPQDLAQMQSVTSSNLETYQKSLTTQNTPAEADPYLLKSGIDKSLTDQLKQENYLIEAYTNVQNSFLELEKHVVAELQSIFKAFANSTGMQGRQFTELANKLLSTIVTKSQDAEWAYFLQQDGHLNFIDVQTLKPRSYDNLEYGGSDSRIATPIRSGYLERRSKYLKNYSKAWYVLTPSYLHEFKNKHDGKPTLSLSLDNCQISHDNKPGKSYKFILNTRESDKSKDHNWVFRAESKQKLDEWYNDLYSLIQFKTPTERAQYASTGGATYNSTEKVASSAASISSEVSSVDVPYDATSETSSSQLARSDEVSDGAPGKFTNSFKGLTINTAVDSLIIPAQGGEVSSPTQDDNSSVFSYDLKKETHSTLPYDQNFEPCESHVPVHVERKLTLNTNHKEEEPIDGGIGVAQLPHDVIADPHEARARRRSSVTVPPVRKLSRKPTGSYGIEPMSVSEESNTGGGGLFFAGGLPDTTSSGQK